MFLTANCHVYYIFRYGFSTEKDYNDSESYCGGWARQHQRNGGKCGVCGDAWDLPQVSSHTSSRERFFPLPSLFFCGQSRLTPRHFPFPKSRTFCLPSHYSLLLYCLVCALLFQKWLFFWWDTTESRAQKFFFWPQLPFEISDIILVLYLNNVRNSISRLPLNFTVHRAELPTFAPTSAST